MKFTIFLIIGFIGLFLLFLLKLPGKESIQQLVMPGLLAEVHARYENQCTQCHSKDKATTQRSLCLSCHKDVAEDIKVKNGFHGHIESVESRDCKSCHSDHKGRQFDMVHLDKETFKHERTGYDLKGAHGRIRISCESCHVSSKKYREAPTNCYSCHSKDDHHQGKLGKNCTDCHNEIAWKETYFDHAKTKFPLTGKHQQVHCNACHADETYKNTPQLCVACHLVNDIHDSPREERCERCHNTTGWKKISYDHNKETKFKLEGKHSQVTCSLCHKLNIFKNISGKECIDCHQLDDVHKGKHGTNCLTCHNNTEWKTISFDHDRDTHFKLLGQHSKVACDACHKAISKDMRIEATCFSCHQSDDAHKGQEGKKCESCHNEKGWREGIKFDHDLTHFPLIGQHAVVACAECHQSSAFKETKMECFACHQKDDSHHKSLGTNCGVCHNPNGWKLWRFDHNAQTNFKLEGAHEGIKCQACHKVSMEKHVQLSSKCYNCHLDDDIHHGQFGEGCDNCHGVVSFKDYKIKKGM